MVEGTAGNTGIGLAHVCRAKGYKLVIFMPDSQVWVSWYSALHVDTHTSLSQSKEKIDLLRLLGADVYPVPAVAYENPANYNHQARDYAASLAPHAFWTHQFDNTSNARIHYLTTGPEIWEQTEGTVDAFICSTGTGGTLAGVARYLREKSDGRVKNYLADPPGSVLYSYITSGGTLTERSGSSITEGEFRVVMCLGCARLMVCGSVGIGQGRITDNLATEIKHIEGALHIPDSKTILMVYDLLDKEGIYLGASSALNVVAAVELAEKLGPGALPLLLARD